MFTDDFRSRLADGKYTRWATDLDENRLAALLWVVGEFGMRAPVVTRQLDKHVAEIDPVDVGYARARFALDAIFMIVQGQHCSVDDLTSRIEDVLRRVRSQP